MNSVTTLLIELQTLETGLEKRLSEAQRSELTAKIEKVRGQIPITVQGHYDRLKAVGRKPMAAIVNGTCQGCYLSLPCGDILRMKTSDDIHLCEHCGRYVYPSEEVPVEKTQPSKPSPVKPPKRRTVKAKTSSKSGRKRRS